MFTNSKIKIIFLIGTALILSSCTSKENPEKDYGFPLSNIDSSANPANDFYQYAVGNWIKNNPIPKEYSQWGTFAVLAEKNYKILHKILEDAANNKDAGKGSIQQKIGDFYFAGMDTDKIEADGIKPIEAELNKIDAINTKKDLLDEIVYQHVHLGAPLFSFGSGIDAKNSKMEIAQLVQGGLGLPDKDYYLNKDSYSKEVREKYINHLTNMFRLIGEKEPVSKEDASAVMNIETRLAKASMSKVERRDPNKTYHKMNLVKLEQLSPGFNWSDYFKKSGIPNIDSLNVEQPDFFKEVSKVVEETPIDNWKPYLKWNLVNSSANYLDSNFVNEHFDFYSKFLYGSKVLQPRWKRVLFRADGSIGELLGQLYVKEVFPPEAKVRALKIVRSLLEAMQERINNLDWMSPDTKKQALHKLDLFKVKIGYPDKWIDYKALNIERDSYYTNAIRCAEFSFNRDIKKIDNPVDPTEWEMTPQTVNAYYEPLRNEIVFPAAILQPPFFNQNADDAINYGAMGAVIGHEITHGFDDQGRQYDASGNVKDWWTKDDETKFNEHAKKIIEQFDSYMPVDTMHVNGKLTEGENIADLGGLNVSFTAFKKTDEYKSGEKIDGYTPTQRFFLGWAQVWESNTRPQTAKLLIKTDPHSPDRFRVNGPFSNMPEFWKAFNVKEGEPMRAPAVKLVKIW
ncbi:MAG: M13 family metallopeptidase [Ignavibacteriaceae bacterium]